MAKKNQVYIDVVIDDKGTTKRVAVNAKKLGIELDKAAAGADKAAKGTDELDKSSRNASRNMQGLSKRTSNSSKEFSKMSQGMGGLVGAYATLAAQVFAVSAAFQFLSDAMNIKNLIAGQEALGAVTGTTYKTITNSIIEATDAQLKYADAAKAAAIGTAAGLSAGQLEDLGKAAKNVSFALGRDLTDSFNRLVRGVTKAEPELLDELGIILRLDPAVKKYKQALNITGRELTAFEKTQAVTNEVLDQAENKFAKIEALMDPNAAALAKFQKSFDELINSFKIGLVSGLTPVLQFFSENTKALIATLALFAVPILKAILPAFGEWGKALEENLEKNKKFYTKQRRMMKLHLNASKKYWQDQAALAKEHSDKAMGVAAARGSDTTTPGMSGLTGSGQMSSKERTYGGKMIAHAEAQLEDKSLKKRTGALRKHSAEQIAILRKNYDTRIAMAESANVKIRQAGAATITMFKAGWAGVPVFFGKVMGTLVSIARGAAIAMNVAFGAIAFFGLVTLGISGVTALINKFAPLSREQEKNKEVVDELSDRYKTLSAEMIRNHEARKTMIAGAERQMNIGKTFQGADVGKMLKDVDEFQAVNRGDRGIDTAKYDQTREDLMKSATQLALVDRRFLKLAQSIRDGNRLTKEQKSELKQAANQWVEYGQKIAAVPEQIKLADEAFSNLMNGMTKTTPLSNYINLQDKAIEGLRHRAKASGNTATVIQSEIDTAKNLRTSLHAEIDAIKDLDDVEKRRLKRRLESDREGNRKRGASTLKTYGIEDVTKKDAWRSKEQLEQMRALKQESLDAQVADGIAASERRTTLQAAKALEVKMLQTRKAALDLEIEAAEKRTLGLTTVGQLVNLEGDRLKSAQALLTAQENFATAEFALKHSKAEERSIEKKAAIENRDIAKKQLELAKANAKFAETQADEKERELKARQDILKEMKKERGLNNQIAALKLKGRLIEGTSDGSAAAARKGRANTTEILQLEVEAARQRAIMAASAYNETYQAALRELQRVEMEKTGGTLSDATQARLKDQAMLETEPDMKKVDSANNALSAAAIELEIQKQLKQTALDKVATDTKNLENLAAANYFDQAGLQFLEKKRELEDAGFELSKEDLKNLEKETRKQHELNQIIEMKQGIADSITGNMESAFMSIVDGSKSAKQAFADMAKAILADIAKMIIKLLVQKAIMAAMGMADGGVASPAGPSAAYGGVFGPRQGRKFTSGGIARGGTQGYPATLHGTEAVVPLPHNRKIPVELMGGAGGQQNNVSVTVNMASGGSGQDNSQTTSDSNQASQLGDIIAKAVQSELQNQKRSGGILNPYGVA